MSHDGAVSIRSVRPRRLTGGWRLLAAAVVPLGALGLVACDPPAVRSFTVDTSSDDADTAVGDGICRTTLGGCSLRAAVQEGNALADPGVVEITIGVSVAFLSGSTGEEAAQTGDLDLDRPFRILGTGSETIDMNGSDRIFDLHPGSSLVIRGLRLDGAGVGVVPRGGLIQSVGGGEVTLDGVASRQARALNDGATVHSDGLVTINRSYLENSIASQGGGGAVVAARLVMTGSTIDGPGSRTGSAVVLTDPAGESVIESSFVAFASVVGNNPASASIVAAGPLSLRDATIAYNGSPVGAISGPSVTAHNSIVAHNNGPDCTTPIASLGSNLEAGTSCGFTAPADLQSSPFTIAGVGQVDKLRYFVTAPGPAIDSGAGCLATDIGGRARPIDGNGDGVASCDRGAYEADATSLLLSVDSAVDVADAVPGDGACYSTLGTCSLRAAVQESNAWPTADTIRIDPAIGALLTVAGVGEDAAATGDLDINDDLTITSTSAALAVIGANDIDRVFDIHSGTVVFDHLHLTNGTDATGAGGGGVRTSAGSTFTLRDSQISANELTAGGGGGGLRADGAATVERSTFNANRADHGGAARFAASASVQNSTLTGNSAPVGSALTSAAGASVAVVDSTLSSNSTGVGVEKVGAISARNTIIANHSAGGNCSASLATLGNNLESATECGFFGAGDVQNAKPALGNLVDNGGPTPTRLPAAGSPAIGTGSCVSTTDQRGIARPQGGACDKGAVEQA